MTVFTKSGAVRRPAGARRGAAIFTLGLLMSLPGAMPAAAVPVANAGFETGDLTGWTLSGETYFLQTTDFGQLVSSGSYAALLGPYGATGSLSQTLTVVPGATYEVSFWLSSLYYSNFGPPSSSFEVFFDGVSIYSHVNALDFPATEITRTVTVDGDSTAVLEFRARNDLFFWGLDDVAVTCTEGCGLSAAIDEPGGLALLAFAVALAGFARGMTKRLPAA